MKRRTSARNASWSDEKRSRSCIPPLRISRIHSRIVSRDDLAKNDSRHFSTEHGCEMSVGAARPAHAGGYCGLSIHRPRCSLDPRRGLGSLMKDTIPGQLRETATRLGEKAALVPPNAATM